MNNKVWLRHRGGAGGVVHEFNLDFNASDTIEVEAAVADAVIAKYPETFEEVDAPAKASAKQGTAQSVDEE